MRDDELLQYAQLHKNDPYIFPLTFQESNLRKQVRAEEAAQDTPTTQVVDKNLQEMAAPAPQMAQGAPQQLPEDVGIGQLPAPNMQRMAGGGIVAFDEGGEVPRFQEGGNWASKLKEMFGGDPEELSPLERIRLAYLRSQEERKPVKAGANPFSLEGQAALPGSAAYMATEQATNAGAPRVPGAAPAAPPLPAAPAPGGGRGIKPGGGQGLNPAAGGQGLMAGIPGLTQTATGTAQEFQNMRDQFGQPTVSQAVKDQINTYRQAREEDTQATLKELQADQAKQGLGMEKAEERAKARETKLGKREAELPGLAIFQAGLAIMSGESPHGLVNIGKGAGVGAKAYTEGLDKLEASREKLDEAFDKIDMFRQNRADMNAKEIRAAQKDIRATKTEAEKLGLDALIEDGKMNRADARFAFGTMSENRAKMYDINSRERMGLAQIASQERVHSMPGAQERMFSKLGGGDLGKGLKAYADIMGPEAKGEWSILQKYAGPQGEMALKIMEAEGPEGKLRAQQIRAKLQSALLTPVNVESARP
jgi:hypothetical protein